MNVRPDANDDATAGEEPAIALRSARRTPLAVAGGSLGVAGGCIGLLLFLVACAGFDAAFSLSIIPCAFGLIGLILTVAGVLFQRSDGLPDAHVLFALFTGLLSVLGGLIEFAAWRGWPLLFGAVQGK